MYINYGILALVSCDVDKMMKQSALAETTEKLLTGLHISSEVDNVLQEVITILQMMRELAIQATSDTLTLQDREQIQIEIDKLKGEICKLNDEIGRILFLHLKTTCHINGSSPQ